MPTQDADYWRQLAVFDPQKFHKPVHVIGVGATGSYIAFILAKMGVRDITVWDDDRIETHNLPNQIYGIHDVGKLKVEALKEIITRDCGITITAKAEKVDGSQRLQGIIYVCTDTMSSRKTIWEKALKLKPWVDLVIETRLAAEIAYIYTIRPFMPTDVEEYDKTLYSDESAEESACTYRAIVTLVSAIAGLAAHKLVKFAASSPGESDIKPVVVATEGQDHSSFEMICVRPTIFTATDWGTPKV